MILRFKSLLKFSHNFLQRLHSDSLYRNSVYLMASQLVLAVFGFFFWMLNARLFESEQIGIATTLISISLLITTLSQLGFNNATVTYLPREKDKQTFIDTTLFMVIAASVVFSTVFLLLLNFFSPPLLFLRSSVYLMFVFIFFSALSTVNAITDSFFVALRDTKYILIIDIIVAITKLVMPIVFISLAALGIFYSYVVAVTIGMIVSIFLLFKTFRIHFKPRYSAEVIRKVWKFSSGSYVSSVVGMISSFITPILILNTLGPNASAFYYMPSMIISLLMTIPRSISSSMMAEGSSQDLRMLHLAKKSIKSTYALLIPAILAVAILGRFVLLAFGKQYSDEGFNYLLISSVSLLVVTPNYILGTILNIKRESLVIMLIGIFNSFVNVGLLFMLIRYGLNGVAIANALSQVVLLFLYIVALHKTYNKYSMHAKSLNFPTPS